MTKQTKKIEDLSRHLEERVKELTCLYEISKVAQKSDQSLEVCIENIVGIIPKGWQFPSELNVYIRIDDQEFGNKKVSKINQKANLQIENKTRGEIVVFYNSGIKTKNPFLKEEQQLINQIAVELSLIVNRIEKRELEK